MLNLFFVRQLSTALEDPPTLTAKGRLLWGVLDTRYLLFERKCTHAREGEEVQELRRCSVLLLSQLVLSDAAVCLRICHLPGLVDFCVLTLCPAPTDLVGQSWPRGIGSVGDSVGEGWSKRSCCCSCRV